MCRCQTGLCYVLTLVVVLAACTDRPEPTSQVEKGQVPDAETRSLASAPGKASLGADRVGSAVVGTIHDIPSPDSGTSQRPALVRIEAGVFVMGSPADEQGRKGLSTYRKRSRPWLDVDEEQHRVRLTRSYLMMTTEVTQSQYELTVGSNPSSLPACGPDCPVENVTLQDVHTYADKLSSEEGLEICYGGADPARRQILSCKGYRLPTEAEWEYAGRAGEIRATQNGNLTIKGPLQAPELDSIAWYAGNSEVTYRPAGKCTVWPTQRMGGAPPQESCGPHPVGTKLANAWGLHDMLGNVWEWTADIVGPYESNATDPLSSITPTSIAPAEQATRGGCWGTAPELARLAARVGVFEGSPRGHVGFRLVRTVP